MKKLLMLISLLIVSVGNSYAQSPQPQIEGFWGVKLGDTENNVVSKVRQSYPKADYDRSVNGHPFRIKNVKLAGIDVNDCIFTFSNGILTSAKFTKSAGGRFVNASQVDSFLSSISQQAQSDYQEFCEAISEKYGTPRASGQTVTWLTSNSNSITIKPFTNTPGYIMDDGTTFAAMGIFIIYTKGSHLNDF